MLQRYRITHEDSYYGGCEDVDAVVTHDGEWVKYDDAVAIISDMQSKLSALKSSSNTLNEDEQKWWDILWAQYPRSHDYGKGEQPVPMSSKAATLKRYKINLKKHKVTPEQMVLAIAAYVKEQAARGSYIVALQTLLGDQKAYWVEYLQKEQQ